MENPPPTNLLQAFVDADDAAQVLVYLQTHHTELLTDAAIAELEHLCASASDSAQQQRLNQRLQLLRQARATLQEQAQALGKKFVEWMNTPDWDASEAYLQQHAAELLTDFGQAILEQLLSLNNNHPAIQQHFELLKRCRELGIDKAYAEQRAAM